MLNPTRDKSSRRSQVPIGDMGSYLRGSAYGASAGPDARLVRSLHTELNSSTSGLRTLELT